MRISTRFLAATLLLGSAVPASAQSLTDIVEKYLAAAGGREALSKLTSRRLTGTITLTTPAGNVSGDVEVVSVRPNKERTLITLDLSALGAGTMTVDQRFDGTVGYVIDSVQGNRDITGTQLQNMKNASFPTPLLAYEQTGLAVTLAGREKVGDADAYVLLLTPKSGSPVRFFIDAATFLLVRVVTTVDAPQLGTIEQTTDLTDHRDVDGFKVPFQIRNTTSVQTITATVTKAEHNIPVDPSIFVKPAN